MVADQKQVTDRNTEPLAFMEFVSSAPVRLRVAMDTTHMIDDGDGGVRATWHDAMYDIVDFLEIHAVGRFWCGLGREDNEHFTDDSCEIAVYLADPQDEECLRKSYKVIS